jgi:CheY-like chemotaxis protein
MTELRSGILLVEDDPNDVFLMERAMSKAKIDLPIQVATNGEDAINYLSGQGKYADRAAHPLPRCIFLDLKMPFVDGFEVLEWLRVQPAIGDLNVVVLTSSPEDRDRERAQKLGVKGYIVKPPSPQMLVEVLEKSVDGCSVTSTPVI